MKKDARILIVGHDDIIENSLFDYFQKNGFINAVSSSKIALNTTIQSSVNHFFSDTKPEYVFLGSVRSGGISANQKYPAEFIYSNLESQNNVIHAAYKFGAKKLLFLASSCVYPKECQQPMKEEYLLSAPMEETSEPYSVAKISGIKLCGSYRKQYGFDAVVCAPATVYGPGSDFELETTHVITALISKFYDAIINKEDKIVVWGTGNPRREFLYCDDFVDASISLMDRYNGNEMINIGTGSDISIKELAEIIKEISGFSGDIIYDTKKPDGAPKKLLDNTRISKLGWKSKTTLREGIEKTYSWFKNSKEMELKK